MFGFVVGKGQSSMCEVMIGLFPAGTKRPILQCRSGNGIQRSASHDWPRCPA